MPKIAFSSVATHDWPLDRLLAYADQLEADGVELRTFGSDSTRFACDPALTDDAKIRRLSGSDGVPICCIATGLRFDEPVYPPVVGNVIGDWEGPLREAKRAITLASQIDCPFVRVFAYERHGNERREKTLERVVRRLRDVLDAARNTGVCVVIENGGSFLTAADLAEIIDMADSPLLGASYSVAVAQFAGDDPAAAVNVLSDRLWIAKIKDVDASGRPCRLGEGIVRCEAFVGTLARWNLSTWLVYEWDRAWIEGLAEPENILPGAMDRLVEWMAARHRHHAGA